MKLEEAFSKTSSPNNNDLLLQAIIKLLDYILESRIDESKGKLFNRLDKLEDNVRSRIFATQG